MPQAHSNIIRIALLAAIAVVLGTVLMTIDSQRRKLASTPVRDVSAAPASKSNAGARRAAAAGALVAGGAIAAAPAAQAAPIAPVTLAKRGGVPCARPYTTVSVPRDLQARATPGGQVIGKLPARSKYLGANMQAWVQTVSKDGAWGKVTVPWGQRVSRAGWIPMAGLQRSSTKVLVVGDVSDRMLRVYRGCTLQFEAPMAVGAAGSPSPLGRFWVTDPVAVPKSQPYFGSYAFGLSTIQPKPPKGWTGGNQMAIHGTNTPGSIGTAASAGCLRVGERTLTRLRASVASGTPVVITR